MWKKRGWIKHYGAGIIIIIIIIFFCTNRPADGQVVYAAKNNEKRIYLMNGMKTYVIC